MSLSSFTSRSRRGQHPIPLAHISEGKNIQERQCSAICKHSRNSIPSNNGNRLHGISPTRCISFLSFHHHRAHPFLTHLVVSLPILNFPRPRHKFSSPAQLIYDLTRNSNANSPQPKLLSPVLRLR